MGFYLTDSASRSQYSTVVSLSVRLTTAYLNQTKSTNSRTTRLHDNLTSEAHPVDWTYSAGLNPGADTHEECRKLYSLSDLFANSSLT